MRHLIEDFVEGTLMINDYSHLGLKIGIEIHQQLATSKKLFCGCKAELSVQPLNLVFIVDLDRLRVN